MGKTVSILGDTQRQQWHSVVNMLRQLGGDMTREGRAALCDELDRYIDSVEDILDEIRAEEQDDPPVLCDRNGDPRMTVEEQESLVRWALEHRPAAVEAISTDDWGETDPQDIEDFLAIVRKKNPVNAINAYWGLDTLARDIFIGILQTAKGEQT